MSNGTTSPAVSAAGDQPPALGKRLDRLLEQLAADVLEDEVDAAPAVTSITRAGTSSVV